MESQAKKAGRTVWRHKSLEEHNKNEEKVTLAFNNHHRKATIYVYRALGEMLSC
jgi:hypothetical protein